jgi:hypothetical protein
MVAGEARAGRALTTAGAERVGRDGITLAGCRMERADSLVQLTDHAQSSLSCLHR